MEVNYKQRNPKNQKSNFNRWTPPEPSDAPITTAPSGDYRRHVSETSHSHEGGSVSYETSRGKGGDKSKVKNNSKKHVAMGGAGASLEASMLSPSDTTHSSMDRHVMSPHLCFVNGYVKPNKYGACVSPYYCTSIRENRICKNCGEDARAAQVKEGIMDENAGRGWIHGICGFGWICRKNTKDGRKPCTLNHPKLYSYCESYERSSPSAASASSIVRATVESASTMPIRIEKRHVETRVSRVEPEMAATFANAVTNVISARAAASVISTPTLASTSTVSAIARAPVEVSEIELDSLAHLMVSDLLDDAPPGLGRNTVGINSASSSVPEPSIVARMLATPPSVSPHILKAREAKLLFDTTLKEAMRINDMSDNMSYDAMLIGIRTAMYHIQQRVNSI